MKQQHNRLSLPVRSLALLVLAILVVFVIAPDAQAQRRKAVFGKKTESGNASDAAKPGQKKTTPPGSAPPAAASKERKKDGDKNEFAPETVELEVKGEGIRLVATWFPPIIEDEKETRKKKKKPAEGDEKEADKVEQGKQTAPFILLHDWSRSRGDMFQLALFLQSKGHAVIVPDLRGHGESLRVAGSDQALDYKKFRKAEKASAVGDIDQCKRFLQEKNNEGMLNIDLLNVMAVGDSAHLAIAWSITDWSWGPVAGIKQGRDVKSITLFSPTKVFAGSALKKLTREPLISGRNATPIPLLIVWGKQSPANANCSDFVKQLRKFRPEASSSEDMATRWLKQNLFHFEASTAMQGHELAANPQAKQIWSFANDFVSQKVIAFQDQCPWQIRGAEAVLKARAASEK